MKRRIGQSERRQSRRGAAIVEFAIIAPVFLALTLGVIELGGALKVSNTMAAAVREGGRLASMDWDGIVPDGMTPNEKVLADIQNFMAASGIPVEAMTLEIVSEEGGDAGQPFDLSAPENHLRLFRINARLPYSAASTYPACFMQGQDVRASLVFRNGRISMVAPE
jgi:hypothetical protein